MQALEAFTERLNRPSADEQAPLTSPTICSTHSISMQGTAYTAALRSRPTHVAHDLQHARREARPHLAVELGGRVRLAVKPAMTQRASGWGTGADVS